MNTRPFGKRSARLEMPAPYVDPASAVEDFAREIEETRRNEHMMALLRKRAEDPAPVSLQEVKQRLGLQ
jgi:hypothetical protein